MVILEESKHLEHRKISANRGSRKPSEAMKKEQH